MRINRDMVLKIARDTVEKYTSTDRTLLAIYLQGSLLGDSPLIGNTTDIDLFFVHTDEARVEREIIRISDEIHLDISHHSHALYRQPRDLRVHAWLGPAVYSCKIMYDPQHFMDFVQASVRSQFNSPANVLHRVNNLAKHAREMWLSFYTTPKLPDPGDASLYLHALEHIANAVAGLNGHTLSERRFLADLPAWTKAVNRPGLYAGFLGLLGAHDINADVMRSWLSGWQAAYAAIPGADAPVRLHPHRWLYFQRAVEAMLSSSDYQTALWPLWRTWTHAICVLPPGSELLASWQHAGEQLGLLGSEFFEKIRGLDAFLDTVEELLEDWAHENGV